MNALLFAWRSLVRQPARATLGILGVAAAGALLLDMLLLSNGLVISMRDLLNRLEYDIRVTATDALPGLGPKIADAGAAATAVAALPSVRSAMTLSSADAEIERGGSRARGVLLGTGGSGTTPWTLLRGRDIQGDLEVVINENGERILGAAPDTSITVRASCTDERQVPPALIFRVAGVARFPFDDAAGITAATTAGGFSEACGGQGTEADFILVTSQGDAAETAADIVELRPDLRAATNDEVIGRLQQGGFTYFQQISTVLTTVTLSFALLLITVLLTVSVNQRLGEIAALRALGFSQRRVVADVLAESALIVGIGGLLSLPLGLLLAAGLDRILKQMPQIPVDLHFFVFEPQALGIHLAMLAATAVLAALYPMRIVARLPIAGTLRNEVIS